MDDFAEVEREIGDQVDAGNHFAHRQLGNRCEPVRIQRQCRRTGPRAFEHNVTQVVAHQFADERRAIDMRDDLEQEARFFQRLYDYFRGDRQRGMANAVFLTSSLFMG